MSQSWVDVLIWPRDFRIVRFLALSNGLFNDSRDSFEMHSELGEDPPLLDVGCEQRSEFAVLCL